MSEERKVPDFGASQYSTRELVDELRRREGVEASTLAPSAASSSGGTPS